MGLGTILAIPQEQFFKQPGVSPYAGRNFPHKSSNLLKNPDSNAHLIQGEPTFYTLAFSTVMLFLLWIFTRACGAGR
jgi:hypothetical protein